MKLADVISALDMTGDGAQGFYDHVTHEITWLNDFFMTQEEY